MTSRMTLGWALTLTLVSHAGAKEAVWIEGEAATPHTFKKHGWYDGVNKSLLSGGDWLSHYANEGSGEATYRFTIKEGGQYTWWLRCNPSGPAALPPRRGRAGGDGPDQRRARAGQPGPPDSIIASSAGSRAGDSS